MTCPVCGRYAEPDRETGYDADDVCQSCKLIEEDMAYEDRIPSISQFKQEKVDPIESDLHDMGSVLASLDDLVKDCHDPAKLWDVYVELGQIARGVTELQDSIARKHYALVVKAIQ